MSRARWIAAGGVGLILFSAAVSEHLERRVIERRYREAVESRRQLEAHVTTVLATHDQVTADLAEERRRSQQLSSELAAMQEQMDQTVGRLTEESRTVRTLQLRLAAMQEQMEQLQGELAVALQERAGAPGAAASAVELERIVVSQDAPILQGRVISIHPGWNFVVVNLGWDQVKIGETVSIFRDERLLAKARVERIQEGVCAATILPEWKIADIRPNDSAQLL